MDLLQKIKRMTISALVADEILMAILVLKGGNAIDIAYDLSNRGSVDIDFSMEKDFTEAEKRRIRNQGAGLLNAEFSKEGLAVFDVKFTERPEIIRDEVKSFWGGYCLEFKVIEQPKYEKAGGDLEIIRRNAIPLSGNNSTRFEVDISKYEYITGKRTKDLEGAVLYVYSPEMLALEKLRALCQQNLAYRDVVFSMTPKSRARDFYDIHNLITTFSIDPALPENRELCGHIFEAKRVPMKYLLQIHEQRELHRQSWESVINTINQQESLMDFDYYVDFTLQIAAALYQNPKG